MSIPFVAISVYDPYGMWTFRFVAVWFVAY